MCKCNTPNAPRDTARARAAMCCVCPWGGWRAKVCRYDGERVEVRIRGVEPTCPRGRHGPIVRWWVDWYGVPIPIRAVLWVLSMMPFITTASGARLRAGGFAGCGCVKPLKDLYTRLAGDATTL